MRTPQPYSRPLRDAETSASTRVTQEIFPWLKGALRHHPEDPNDIGRRPLTSGDALFAKPSAPPECHWLDPVISGISLVRPCVERPPVTQVGVILIRTAMQINNDVMFGRWREEGRKSINAVPPQDLCIDVLVAYQYTLKLANYIQRLQYTRQLHYNYIRLTTPPHNQPTCVSVPKTRKSIGGAISTTTRAGLPGEHFPPSTYSRTQC